MKTFLFFLCCICNFTASAQNIVYADVNKKDVERMNFEIIGKRANNYLIYKEVNGNNRITVYDANMNVLEEVPITILPKRDNILDVSFYNSNGNNAYLLYQYQEGDIVYLKAAKIEPNGRILTEPSILDTTMIAYKTENKIYNIVNSNDNSKLMAFKINKKDKTLYKFTTKLFDQDLNQVVESRFSIPMQNKGDHLSGYSLANDGSYVFVKYNRQSNGNIQNATLVEKKEGNDAYEEHALNNDALFLDDIKLMIDDNNGRYLLSSFYSTQKKGSIDGIYTYGFDKNSGESAFEKTTSFSDDFKHKAANKKNIKNAFDDFFINNIVVHSDGRFTINAEQLYDRGNWDRWDSWSSPFWGGVGYWGGWGPSWGWGRFGGYWSPYSFYSPFFYRSYWWGGWGPGFYSNNYQQFNAGNIAIMSFDKDGNKTWENVIVKSQKASQTDGTISYQLLFNGDDMHYLLNNSGKISDLEDIIVNNNGETSNGITIKAKEKRLDFMPKYGKQTGHDEIIIPYSYKSNVSFANVKL